MRRFHEERLSDRRRGFTLVELAVASTLVVMLGAGVMAALDSARNTTETGDRIGGGVDRAGRLVSRIERDLKETSIDLLDTAVRVHRWDQPSSDWMANHFADRAARLSQCTSAACPWNRRVDTGPPSDRRPAIFVGRNRRWDAGAASVTPSGRVWRELSASVCPLDSNFATDQVELDLALIFSPRNPAGDFVTAEFTAREDRDSRRNEPDWQALVIYFPRIVPATATLELVRLVVYRDDLVSGSVPGTTYDAWSGSATPNWDAWDGNSPAGVPSLVELLDFGSDGTLDGSPDGKIPLVPERSDALVDRFEVVAGTKAGANVSYVRRMKGLDTATWYREFDLAVDRETGRVDWRVVFKDKRTGASWQRAASFVRRPDVIARDLVDIDFSTRVSNPYDPVANPWGVSKPRSMRMTLVFELPYATSGGVRRIEHIYHSEVEPRNRP